MTVRRPEGYASAFFHRRRSLSPCTVIAPALPLLVLFALPDDPSVALGELDRYGTVPECHEEEEIVTPLFGPDHEHRFSRPKVVSAVADHEADVLPYLEHPNRKVVLRTSPRLAASSTWCSKSSAKDHETR